MADLSTIYLGLKLANPLVPSASPLSRHIDAVKRMEDAGAGAIVLHSLFEEQITRESEETDYYLTYGAESSAEATTYFPELHEYRLTADQYLEHIRKAKAAVQIPIIGSLNGVSAGSWVKYAQKIEEAGADALELNVYFVPTALWLTGEEIEQMYLDLLRDVRQSVKIPVAMKLSPHFTNMANIAQRLVQAGADGLVLFNRFYQPDIDLEALEVVPRPVLSSLQTPQAMRVTLRWIAILYGRIQADMAASTGIHTGEDAIKVLMAGATVAQMASELLTCGPERLGVIRNEMMRWLDEHEYESVAQMRGSMSQRSVAFPAAFERAHYVRALNSYEFKLK